VLTLQELVTAAATRLASISQSPRLDAELLLAFVLKKDRSWVLAHSSDIVDEPDNRLYERLLARRISGEPIAYITEQKEFFGRVFSVNQYVLVPRPESESFISLLNEITTEPSTNRLIDIGTGSGILAITAKLEYPHLSVTATDIDPMALSVALQNATVLKADVLFKEQDLLTDDNTIYDVVLANLPYVPEDMQEKSILYEPKVALFSGEDGLNHYRILFSQLRAPHFVLTESLISQHTKLQTIAKDAGYTLAETEGLVQLYAKLPT
jgi:release factor glutamine methyltransferase